eukprot:CAMPEP_0182456182 /NCGR_PEP_ID=MMETSP1319-20130603/2096_1 /TAXON_ID=172717 /ORGANISM="Bolidomonas pacifica, Strain RCC208" /LENGTH=313 /DNA_ID=CAMNT_0024654365 /DNA_START=34 /DNA_END=971 /DNA_ORIENTATION=+
MPSTAAILVKAVFLITAAIVPLARADFSRPVVAVFSHPLNSTHDFIAASYVKYLESGGARALRVPYNATKDEIEAIYEQTNGMFFPGGGCDLPQSARYLWSLKLKGEMEEGDVYPAWGTCLGFEWINQLVSEDDSIIATHFNAENISLALDMTGEDSRMMPNGGVVSADGTFMTDVGKLASTYEITMNMHAHGVSVADFMDSEKLSSTFTLISTNKDLDGKEFVSTIESKDAGSPIYATQWHPEKNTFEYGTVGDGDVPYITTVHSAESVRLANELAMFFGAEVRRSTHTYDGSLPLAIDERVGVRRKSDESG